METSITVAEEDEHPSPPQPAITRLIRYIFLPTGLPLIRHKSRIVPITLTVTTNLILGSATFCLLYYPDYYINQAYIWTADILIGWIVYNYSLYLHAKWDTAACIDATPINPRTHYISLTFTGLYYVYWFYFYVIQMVLHFKNSALILLGNALMGTAWYLFFSMMGGLYYAICFTMNQRAEAIRIWLKEVKKSRPSLPDFYLQYNARYKAIRQFSKHWNILVFLGFLLLSFHIPIDLFSVLYSKNYYDSFGLVIKTASLFWYIYCICELNDYEEIAIAYLYKHRLYPASELEEIEKYAAFRPLGLNFYGIKVNHSTMTKVVILTLNFLVPTLYALISNKVFG